MSQKLNYFFISGKKKWSRIYYVESQYETRYDIVLFDCGWMDLYSVVGCVNNKYQIYWRAGEERNFPLKVCETIDDVEPLVFCC